MSQSAPPPPPPPNVSPDGRYLWTGYAWMPLKEPYHPGRPPVVLAPKSPGLHVLFSWFLPGLGTMLAGYKLRGALILIAVYGIGLTLLVLFFSVGFGWFSTCIGTPQTGIPHACVSRQPPALSPGIAVLFDVGWLLATGIYVFGLIDGYRSARAWNRAHGFPG